jgi:hypothetical protein
MQKGQQQIIVVLKASVLASLVMPGEARAVPEADLALANWRDLIQNRANQIVLLNDDKNAYRKILGETFGKSIKRIPGNDIDAILAREKRRNIPIGVIDPQYEGTAEVLTLKPAPASLFLVRPLLEDSRYRDFFNTHESIRTFQKILAETLLGEMIQKSA